MARTYIGKKGTFRLYDGTGTPFYLEFVYDQMDFNGVMGRARPEEILVLDRGTLNSNVHYVQGTDEPILEPVDISISCRLDDTTMRQRLRDALNIDSAATWDVDGDTWVTTKGTTTLLSSTGSSVTTPTFADTAIGKRCVNVEILWDEGSSDIGVKYAEVYFPAAEQKIAEAADSLTVSLSGKVYGAITEITSFTAGNAS
jgi:hypothetical protein